jgi:histidinol-phosphate/aromatic aminotransferase/cobyric acid decarboxylase-like protein
VELIAGRLKLHPQEMLLTPGSDAALRLICQYYLRSNPSDGRLLLQHPNYFAWEQSAELLGLKLERVRWSDMSAPGRELIEAARGCRGALIGISVPNGPVGGCISASELDELIETVRRRGHILTIDACYQAFNGEWIEHLRRRGERVVIVQSLSKSHGLAGVRLGVIAGHANLIEQLADFRLENAVSCAALSLGCALLESADEFEVIWNDIKASRKLAAQALGQAGLRVLPSGGNFLSFHLGSQEQAEAAQRGMSACGYRVRRLTDDDAFSDCLRVTIQDERATLTALGRLFKVLDAGPTLPAPSRSPVEYVALT